MFNVLIVFKRRFPVSMPRSIKSGPYFLPVSVLNVLLICSNVAIPAGYRLINSLKGTLAKITISQTVWVKLSVPHLNLSAS